MDCLAARSCGLLGLLLGTALAAEVTWPQFRGPHGSGVAAGDDFPVHFSPATNVSWKTPLPPGHSSPCLWGNRIFLTASAEPNLETICLDRRDGGIVWRQTVAPGKPEKGGGLGSPAAPTAVTDGQRVYAYFGPFGAVCYDVDGRERWRAPLPTPITQHGVGTSPVLAGDLLILLRDQDVDSHLLALNRRNGKVVWRRERPGFRRGFCTPLVWGKPGQGLIIAPGTLEVVAYRQRDGAEQWRVSGLPNEVCPSPVAGNGLIFAAAWTTGSGVSRMPAFATLLEQGDRNKDGQLSRDEAPPGPAAQHFQYLDANKDGFVTRAEYESLAEIFARAQNSLLAIGPGGPGKAARAQVVWKQTRGLPYVPSPLWYRDRLYLVKNGGIVSCFNATNGVPLYQEERLEVMGDIYASPVAANGKICVATQPGVVVVFAAGDTLQVLARNPLGEPIMATPAIGGGRLYVRTRGHLYAFGPPMPEPGPGSRNRE